MSFAASSAKNAPTPVPASASPRQRRGEMAGGSTAGIRRGSKQTQPPCVLPAGESAEKRTPLTTVPLCIILRIENPPDWFGAMAQSYARAKRVAQLVVQGRVKGDQTSIATLAYQSMPKELPSNVRSQLAIEVMAEWRSYKNTYKQGSGRAMPKECAGPRFVIHSSGLKLFAENRRLEIRARKSTGEWAELRYSCGDRQNAKLLGALKVGECEFKYRQGHWFAHLTARIPVAQYFGQGIAVVRSLHEPFLCALIAYPDQTCISRNVSGEEYWEKREYYRRERLIARQKKKWRMRKHLRGAERRWSNTYTHQLSTAFVGWLKAVRAGVLIVGTHKNIRKREQGPKWKAKSARNWKSAHWAFRMLLTKVVYKAQLAGVIVVQVNEGKMQVRSTCWRCGENVDEENNIVICKCGMRLKRYWNCLRNLLLASGYDGPLRRIDEAEAMRKPAEDFNGAAFGVADMLQRLEFAGKTLG